MPLTPFRRRDPVPLGIGGVIVALALVVAALGVAGLPRGGTYSAAFADSAGLREHDDVVIAGVKVGEVVGVDLEGDHVRVGLRVADDVRLGSLTRADIRIKTLLGAHVVMLVPDGPGRLQGQIPLSRTSVPYEVAPAVADLGKAAGSVDERALAQAMTVLSQTMEGSSAEIRASLRGLGRLSRTVAARDDRLHDLVGHARTVTGLLARRNADLHGLITDGDLLLREVSARRAVVHGLLVNTVVLAGEIDGLVADNRTTLMPTLERLRSFVAVLRRQEESLDRSLALLGPFARQLADVTGNGRWFDTIIQNLVPLPVEIRPPDPLPEGPAR
ncbi:MCE family protein [Nonomuraea sp. WAC 01424]|uniref:MCE family protein n=1 Tax=Nonomuraea sp. WAC 01424 TaxID=2203200 RepID=UPI001C8B9CB7|nr:MCE family protein [Nonomuraea sp. WAC 01424]